MRVMAGSFYPSFRHYTIYFRLGRGVGWICWLLEVQLCPLEWRCLYHPSSQASGVVIPGQEARPCWDLVSAYSIQ